MAQETEMPPKPADMLFQEAGDDRRSPADALLLVINLVRTVDSRLERLENKFDQASDERLKEAEANGKLKAEVEILKEYKRVHEGDHKWMWRAIVGAVITAAVAALFAWKGLGG